ncbi:MAG: hypothetical protein JO053_02955 [Acidobacteria bacterium]|nr:hypothetical protein [Acidobacteriota bacterium]
MYNLIGILTRSLFLFVLVMIAGLAVVKAQGAGAMTPQERQWLDEAIARHAAVFSIAAERTLLEPKETTSLVVHVLLPPHMSADGVPTDMPEDVPFPAELESKYKVTNWHILEGGGDLIKVDNETYSYSAPAAAPPNRTMSVSVDLLPAQPGLAKVVLIQTLYFVQNETAFFVNMPQIGLTNVKCVSQSNGGAKVPSVQGLDPRALANLPPDVRQKMAQAQAQMAAAQGSSGIDPSAVSSNQMSIYDPDNDQTAVRFSTLNVQMDHGRAATNAGLTALLNFNFKGKGEGTYTLNADGVGLGIYLPNQRKGAGCGTNQKGASGQDMPCTGNVVITSVGDKFVKGTVRTAIWTSVGNEIFRGYLYGKFTVNRAR